jgi:hypothetical protein
METIFFIKGCTRFGTGGRCASSYQFHFNKWRSVRRSALCLIFNDVKKVNLMKDTFFFEDLRFITVIIYLIQFFYTECFQWMPSSLLTAHWDWGKWWTLLKWPNQNTTENTFMQFISDVKTLRIFCRKIYSFELLIVFSSSFFPNPYQQFSNKSIDYRSKVIARLHSSIVCLYMINGRYWTVLFSVPFVNLFLTRSFLFNPKTTE